MRPTLDGFCLPASLAQEALTLFSRLLHHPTPQIRPSSAREEKETRAFICEYAPAATSQQRHPAPKKEKKEKKKQQQPKNTKKGEAQTFRRADRQTGGTKLSAGTRARISPAHSANWQTNTQSTAQPEVYFMQEYSKVCFTIQLNIKGGSIPLWSLTPQWTNPRHPHPLTAHTESCWTSLLITRQKTEEDFASLCKKQDIFKCMHSFCHEPFKDCVIYPGLFFLSLRGNCSPGGDIQTGLRGKAAFG